MIKDIVLGRNHHYLAQMFRYAAAGGTATFIDVGLLFLLADIMGVWYIWSVIISFCSAAVVNFFMQKLWTFGNKEGKHARQLSTFFAVAGTGMLLHVLIISALVEMYGIWHIYGKIAAIFVVGLWSFNGNKFITFRSRA